MHKFKYFNNIAKEGLLTLSNNQFEIDDIKPDAILLRSHALNESEFTDSLKCIAGLELELIIFLLILLLGAAS